MAKFRLHFSRGKMLAILLLITGQLALGQMPQGRYEGALTRDGSVQLISMNFRNNNATYDIPEIGYYDVSAETLTSNKDTIDIHIFYGNFYCFLDKKTGDITGISKEWNPKIKIHLKQTAQKTKNFDEEEITFTNSNISLSGVLFKPQNIIKPIPYVILIHGSDYQDRNTPYYHSLAYTLASKGIGVLLYDKRGCGKSTGHFETTDFHGLAKDAISAFQYLKNRSDLHISKIGLLGTSQGGWVAPLAANQLPDCSFVILNAGPAVSLFEQDIDRVRYSMMDDGVGKAAMDSAINYSKLYFKYVQTNRARDWKELEKYASAIKDKNWNTYVNIPKSPDDTDLLWWKTNGYDPSETLKKIKCPVLSIFGEKDVLVPPAENKSKMESYLKSSGVKYKIIVVDNCGHDMIAYQGLNGPKWNWPMTYWQWRKQPQEFINSISDWIEQ